MKRRTKEQQKEIVIDYIKKDSTATIPMIRNNLGINVHRIFGGIENAFNAAKMYYPRKRNNKLIKKEVIKLIKNDPLITIPVIENKLKISFFKHFKSMKSAYKLSGIKWIPKHLKRRLKKEKFVLNFIKNNPNTTQWEINKNCKCHIQEMFNDGIREAFEKAKIIYPEKRRKIYGIAKKDIKHRSMKFEKEILDELKEK